MSRGVPKVGAGTCVGLWCVILPFRLAILGPKMISAFITSHRVIGMSLEVWLSIEERKVDREGHPIVSWIYLASFSSWYSLFVNDYLWPSTVVTNACCGEEIGAELVSK